MGTAAGGPSAVYVTYEARDEKRSYVKVEAMYSGGYQPPAQSKGFLYLISLPKGESKA